MYCALDKDTISIYLHRKDLRKCTDYVASLDASIVAVYKDMVTVQKLIDIGRDAGYWMNIKSEMQTKIDGYQQMRSIIFYRIAEFERLLFNKINLYMQQNLLPYKSSLEAQLNSLYESDYRLLTGDLLEVVSALAVDLQNQLVIIDSLLGVSNLEELVLYLPSYLYLKKQIE